MRILQVGKFYYPTKGGMETMLKSLCDGLRRHGHGVRCLVANSVARTETDDVDGVEITRVASFGAARSVSLSPGFIPAFRTLARDADVIHIHQQNPLADLAVLLVRPTAPLVVTCHSGIVRQRIGRAMWQPLLTRVWRNAERVIATSPPLARVFAGCDGGREAPVVIPHGIDLPVVTSDDGQGSADDNSEAPLLLSVGRLVGYKGFEYLIAAMQHIPHACLVVAGDGPLRSSLQRQAAASGVAARVEFAGAVPAARLDDLFQRCAVFVLPSVTAAEAFGIVQLEAMAYGKPVVSTDLPTGVPWVNRHGETGLVVAPRSPQALAQAVNDLLAAPELRRRMGVAGRRRVEEEFTTERMVCRHVELYQQLLAPDQPPLRLRHQQARV